MNRLLIFMVGMLVVGTVNAVSTTDTRMLQMPTMSESQIAFVYDNSIWTADRSGKNARRLTTAAGEERFPVLSADGRWIAFSGNYDGNTDVYVMPSEGGVPKRLTWHPGADIVRGFAADGAVLFQSARSVYTRRHRHLYTVPVDGGVPSRLPVPTGFKAAVSGDGKRIAYSPHAERFRQWKNYRGGTVSRIWVMDLKDFATVEVPQPDERSNDTDPMWIDGQLYFNSDRNGEFNLFRFDEALGTVTQLTSYDDFPVIGARAQAGGIIFEQAGRLHVYQPDLEVTTTLRVGVGADLREARARWTADEQWVRSGDLSPGGERIAVEYRGEILNVPAKNGDALNLTQSPGAHDRSPAWSADGQHIAWFSDEGGEYGLHIRRQDGSEPARRLELDGAGFYFDPAWSPDGSRIAYRDNALALYVIELESGRVQAIAQEPTYTPYITLTYSWSPDSNWLAYTLNKAGLTQTVHLWSVTSGESTALTDGLAEVGEPVFDAQGEHLFMLGSTDAGPMKDWFAQSNLDIKITHQVYAATLAQDGPNPVPPRNDIVAAAEESEDEDESEAAKKDGEEAVSVRIDFEDIMTRVQPLITDTHTLRNLRAGADGYLYFLESADALSFDSLGGGAVLKRYSLKERETKSLAKDVNSFELSRDGKKILYSKDNKLFMSDTGDKLDSSKIALNKLRVWVEPREEWQQIFDEAWRINRDYFYATNYHGADWDQVRSKYQVMVPHAATRSDLERIIRWMSSELAVGHSYSGSGDSIEEPAEVSVGLLGADFEVVDGRYQFSKVFGGLNWTPNVRSPLTVPGVTVRAGEFLLEVDGRVVNGKDNLYRFFENTVGRQVKLLVGPHASGRDSREVIVEPIRSEARLRNRDWVEGNLKKVHEATDGRVAYVYVPNTTGAGHEYFKRYFYPQSHLDAIIVDERYNGGGQFADYYIDHLRRPFAANWSMRYGADLPSPRGAIFGPKVMIMDETAGSGGDLLPWMFRKYELGPLVGKRTWGGLVGILGFPTLMDGGSLTAPNLAIWNEDGWIVENEGVPPDVEVTQWPAQVNAGMDPQLEKAIELVMQMLRESPPRALVKPPFPQRARQ